MLYVKEYETKMDVEALAIEMGLIQVSDDDTIEAYVDEVLAQHPEEVSRYRAGKTALMGFFVGQVMKVSGGQANPEVVKQCLIAKMSG